MSNLAVSERMGQMKGVFAEVVDVCSHIDCWSAAEYASDCHDSGALSFVLYVCSWVHLCALMDFYF